MKKLITTLVFVLIVSMSACGGTKQKHIETKQEKIGLLTVNSPVGWEKSLDESEIYNSYTYSVNEDGDALLMIYYYKDPTEAISISDFDYTFDEFHEGIDIVYTDTKDSFLGDKPIRTGTGTWQYNYNGKVGDLYDITTIAMYDADKRRREVQYMYKDSLSSEGYSDYATELVDTMELVYSWNQ